MSFAQQRSDLVAAFSTIPNLAVFDYVPPSPSLPCLILFPSDPYFEPTTIGGAITRGQLNFVLALAVPYLDNQGALNNIEDLMIEILQALPQNATVGAFNQPSSTELGSANVLAAQLDLSVPVTVGD